MSGFPSAANTGVPAGTDLSAYRGPCTLTADAAIDAKVVNCGGMIIRAGHTTITRSMVHGPIDVEGNGRLTISDSEVDGQDRQMAALSFRNLDVTRVNVHDAQHGVQCDYNCTVRDSYIHIDVIPPGVGWHMNAFISNGGSDITLTHNTLRCAVPETPANGGCTADASIFGDFGPNNRFTFDHNLFLASTLISYCAYGGTDPKKPYGTRVSGIVFENNVFERGTNGTCGRYGLVTSFDRGAPGNVWTDNVWTTGEPATP